jgi:hypothetical protein
VLPGPVYVASTDGVPNHREHVDPDGKARGMSQATPFKLDQAPAEASARAGVPPLSLQQVWFALHRLEWASLVLVPGDENGSVIDFGRPLYEVARLAMGDRVRLLDARDVKLNRTAPLILDMHAAPTGRAGGGPWSERALVMINSVISHPSGVPIALAADAAVLCVEMGRTSLSAGRRTLQILGAQRFVGCVTLPSP